MCLSACRGLIPNATAQACNRGAHAEEAAHAREWREAAALRSIARESRIDALLHELAVARLEAYLEVAVPDLRGRLAAFLAAFGSGECTPGTFARHVPNET